MQAPDTNDSNPIPVTRMSRDIAAAAASLGDHEARFLVDAYYMMQDDRKRAHNQIRALGENNEPNSVLQWLAAQSETIEAQIKRALDKYTQAHPMGKWMRQIHGIGPVISAGLLAHLSIERWVCSEKDPKKRCRQGDPCSATCGVRITETVGHWWSFAGLDPRVKWEKGQLRPWNERLKTLLWKAGQSFMKFSNDPDCFYGRLYRERKAYEIERNDRGDHKELAATLLLKVARTTEAYKHLSEGRLPPGQIDARARRWAVKLMLSHLHAAWYEQRFGRPPPKPYAIAILGHADFIAVPH